MANGRAAKAHIYDTLGIKVKARSGRGTAHSWLYIDLMGQQVTPMIKDVISAICVRQGYCGSYLPDALPGKDEWTACIRFENEGR